MTKLDNDVLRKIERLGLKPRPYIAFLGLRCMYWSAAVLSVLLGAVSVAILIFSAIDLSQTGGRGFDEMPFDDIALAVPAFWGLCFILFVASAWLTVSRTKRGYRYRPSVVIALSVSASLLIGIGLYRLDAGRMIHEFLSSRLPAYKTYTTIPYDEWTRPDLGFLGGEVLAMDGNSLRLKAFDGTVWLVDIAGAEINTDGTPYEEGDVAIRGIRTGPLAFKALSVAPFD